jgi:hypothetical protein
LNTEDGKSIGQLAFEAYSEQMGGVTYDNKPIPTWDQVSKSVRDGWHKAAQRVLIFAIETDMFFPLFEDKE